jgi:hypothetical protein
MVSLEFDQKQGWLKLPTINNRKEQTVTMHDMMTMGKQG